MEKLQLGLAIVGAVALGIPAILRAVLAMLKAIPGDQFEPQVEKILAASERISELVLKLYPGNK